MPATQTDHAVYQVHVEVLADDRDQLVELGILVAVVAGGCQVHTLARCDVNSNDLRETCSPRVP